VEASSAVTGSAAEVRAAGARLEGADGRQLLKCDAGGGREVAGEVDVVDVKEKAHHRRLRGALRPL